LVGWNKPANKKGKNLNLNNKIVDLGLEFSATSNNPIDSANRFVSDLLEMRVKG